MNAVGERVGDGNHPHPFRESAGGIDGPAREKEQGVQDAESGAGDKRVVDAHHEEKHHADERQRRGEIHQRDLDQARGRERVGNAGDEGAEHRQHQPGDKGLDGPRQIEAEDQSELGDGRDEVALVKPSGLIINIDNTSADHR